MAQLNDSEAEPQARVSGTCDSPAQRRDTQREVVGGSTHLAAFGISFSQSVARTAAPQGYVAPSDRKVRLISALL